MLTDPYGPSPEKVKEWQENHKLLSKKDNQNLKYVHITDATYVGGREPFLESSVCVAFVFVRERCAEKFQA